MRVEMNAEGETDVGEKGLEAGEDGGTGGGGMKKADDPLGREGDMARQTGEAKAAISAVGAGGEVGDAEGVGGSEKDGAWGRHAIDHGEDLELGLEFVRDEVDGEVGGADGIFYCGGEVEGVKTAFERGVFELGCDAAEV